MFEIFNETNQKIEELDIINKMLNKIIKNEKLEQTIFNVIIVDNKRIHEINKEFRNIDKPTDVISFALEDFEDITYDFRLLGDIYISIDKAREQAKEYGHSLKRELCFLTVHGLLHLLGYNHEDERSEKVMFAKQEAILNELEISR